MKTYFPVYLILLLSSALALFSGCESKEQLSVNEVAALQDTTDAMPTSDKAERSKQEFVIRQAEVKFQVQNLEASTQRVEALVENAAATLTSTTQHQSDETRTTDFVIRVRPEKFMPLLQQIQKESMQLDIRTITTEDVAMEYVDLEARRNAKLAVEKRFIGLLKEAKNIQQILEVENQIKTIREEIESAEARLRYLQNQTAYSTVNLAMYQMIPVAQPEEPGFGQRVLVAMSTGWQLLLSLLIGCFYIWPLWFLGAGILIYLRKRNLA